MEEGGKGKNVSGVREGGIEGKEYEWREGGREGGRGKNMSGGREGKEYEWREGGERI